MADYIPATQTDDANVDQQKLAEQREALNAMYLASKTSEATKELAVTLKYQGSLNPDVLEDGIRESQGRIGAELFQMGSRLLLLKEQCQHGEFLERLERLDINHRAAQKFMQVSAKFANAPLTAHLQKLGKTKVLELLALDDQEIKELGEDGSVRGLELDEIDRMSCSELRKKLRKANNEAEVKQRLLESKNEKIDELLVACDAKQAGMATPHEELVSLHNKCGWLVGQINTTILTELRSLVVQICDHHHLRGGDSSEILNGYLNQITAELGEVRAIFGGLEEAEPEWQKWNEDQQTLDLDQGGE